MSLDFTKSIEREKTTIIGLYEKGEWEEISQGEYRRLKREDPHKCNGYTSRIGFKYYKKKPKDKIIQDEFSDVYAEILDNGWVTLREPNEKINLSLGKYPNARFDVIERLLKEVKKDEQT